MNGIHTKLSYRGASYDATLSTIETVECGLTGRYRGADVRFSAPMGVALPQSVMTLKYRGASYLTFR